ncbi:AraC family transcriptional regulator [Azospirillum sp. TSO35-2]|uniref:AraC family transcriptional regulator n=1 Tax=Azospirillum sp. TSO35-2 TaxID=716796 RepID=UPI000D612260|nr:AraC family transcriptional regulator [Azospirillum sp. TSO35-2]PWC33596.1 hypothetical protein TSO352_24570 [Azospirillum sp. TSO35-2]
MARPDTANLVRYWQDRTVGGLFLLHADFTRHDYAPHTHEAIVVAVTEAGGSEFRSRGVTQEATSRSLLVFNPAEVHSGRMGSSGNWRYRSFYLRRPAIDHVARLVGIDRVPGFTENRITDTGLADAFLALHRLLDGDGDPMLAQERLAGCFGGLIDRHAAGAAMVPRAPGDAVTVAPLLALIHDRHADPLTLDDLAREAGLTVFQLIRLFKRTVGLTPHGYLTQVRLTAAVRRLERGARLADAAIDAGFYDQSAFTRHFKRAYGITPRCYVRAFRG